MKRRFLLPILMAVGLLAIFTAVSSYALLRWNRIVDDFDFPFYQWWFYLYLHLFVYRQTTLSIWLQLLATGSIGALLPILLVRAWYIRRFRAFRNTAWRPRMDRRDWQQASLPSPPIIGATDNYGHAKWATDDEMRERWPTPRRGQPSFVMGELYNPQLIEGPYISRDKATWGPGGKASPLSDDLMRGSGHSVRVGGSGAGKTESLKFSLRTTWTGPLVVLDPKQTLGPELAEERRRMGRHVMIINPESADDCGQNVLDSLDPASPLVDPRIDDQVEWVCGVTPEHDDGGNGKFFTGAAKDIVRCLVSHIIADTTVPPELRSLRSARNIICNSTKKFREYLDAIHKSSPSPRARQLAAMVCAEENDTFRGIHYTAQRITAWLSTEAWAKLVCGDAYKASDIVDGNTDIFLGIPFQSLSSEPAVARCILGATFNAVFQRKDRDRTPILFALDEVAQLRSFEPLMTAWTMGREFGIRLHLMYQANGQITKQWGNGGKSTLRNGAGWLAYSAVKDPDDAKELAETIGNYPVVAVSESMQTGTQGRGLAAMSRSRGNTVSYSEMGRPRIRPEEIIGLREDAQIVFAGGIRPMICGLPLDYRRRAFEAERRRAA